MVLTLIPPPEGLSGVFIGKEEVLGWFGELVADNGSFEFSDVTALSNQVATKMKYHSDMFASLMGAPAELEGVAIAHDGKLKSITWVFTKEFEAKMNAAVAQMMDREMVQQYIKAWEQADAAALDTMLADDFVNHSPPLPPDKAGMKTHAAEMRAAFPDGLYTIEFMTAEGDLYAVYGRFQGTHTGADFMGVAASGAGVDFAWSTLLRVRDGQIVERWGTADDVMGLLVPIGYELVPPQ